MQEAKQLLIQQKLELQGQLETVQGTLEQEQKEHQATRDSRSQREEQLLAQTKDVQDQLVGSLDNILFKLLGKVSFTSLMILFM